MNIRQECNLMKALKILNTFGDKEFTAKEYNHLREKGTTTLSTLQMYYIIRLARKETFKIEVSNYSSSTLITTMYTADGHKCTDINPKEYNTNRLYRELATKMYGELHEEYEETKEIEVSRYYYKVDKKRLMCFVHQFAKNYEFNRGCTLYKIENLKRKIEKLDNIMEFAKELI